MSRTAVETHPTPPRPIRATLEAGWEHLLCNSDRISRCTKSRSRRKGTVDDGIGSVDVSNTVRDSLTIAIMSTTRQSYRLRSAMLTKRRGGNMSSPEYAFGGWL